MDKNAYTLGSMLARRQWLQQNTKYGGFIQAHPYLSSALIGSAGEAGYAKIRGRDWGDVGIAGLSGAGGNVLGTLAEHTLFKNPSQHRVGSLLTHLGVAAAGSLLIGAALDKLRQAQQSSSTI